LLSNIKQLIHITQLTSDSWLLVGCWYNNALNIYANLSSTQQSSDYTASKTNIRSPHGKGANNNAISLDNNKDNNDRDNNFRNGSQSSGSESSGGNNSNTSATANNRQLYKEHRRI